MVKECVLADPLKFSWRVCAYLGDELECLASKEQYNSCKTLKEVRESAEVTCKDCKYYSSVRGEYVNGFDGYPAKIIHSKIGHCIKKEWNLLNLDICSDFERE